MEKGLILDAFNMKEQDIRTYSPLCLAYLGDAVYDMIIRTYLVEMGNRPVNELNRMKVKLVNAGAQSEMVKALEDILTEEEKDIVRRGKNSKPASTAKNASLSDYHRATGFEALMGYLYLTDRQERIMELIRAGIEKINKE